MVAEANFDLIQDWHQVRGEILAVIDHKLAGQTGRHDPGTEWRRMVDNLYRLLDVSLLSALGRNDWPACGYRVPDWRAWWLRGIKGRLDQSRLARALSALGWVPACRVGAPRRSLQLATMALHRACAGRSREASYDASWLDLADFYLGDVYRHEPTSQTAADQRWGIVRERIVALSGQGFSPI